MLAQSLRKWGPILDSLNIKQEDIREFVALYAEHHAKVETQLYPFTEGCTEPIYEEGEKIAPKMPTGNKLPLALNILSKLNLEGKELLLVNGQPNVRYTFTFSKDLTDTAYPEDIIVHWIEKEAIKKMVDELNKQLETKNNFRVNILVYDFLIGKAEDGQITMTFEGRFSID